jgi:glycosyltransferase involved in cell wall biosynthesis
MKKQKVLLYGPGHLKKAKKGAYGGGMGGYHRKMGLYLNFFRSDNFEMVPCYHSIKGQYRIGFFVVRFLIDIYAFLRDAWIVRPQVVHVLAQYRRAMPREFALVWLARLFGIKVVYELKAGVFVDWYKTTNSIFRGMAKYCVQKSDAVLGQGMPYVDFVKSELNQQNTFFHPNFVARPEIPEQVREKLNTETLKLLFVGFAYRDKGVFEMIEGCKIASDAVPIELTMIGMEHVEFQEWMDAFDTGDRLKVHRLGRMPHDEVLKAYDRHDIYLYPTRHGGEGHNNSINEAMMNAMVIITTRQGFLGTVLNPDIAYFLDEISPPAIAGQLIDIHTNRESAKKKSQNVRTHLLEHYTSEIAFERLETIYRKLTGQPQQKMAAKL